MALQALKPIALYRLEDTIVFWNDTPVGWDLVNMFGSLPAEGRRVVAELLVESAPAFPPDHRSRRRLRLQGSPGGPRRHAKLRPRWHPLRLLAGRRARLVLG